MRPSGDRSASGGATFIESLWVSFKESPSIENREPLILQYAPLVRYVAGRMAQGLPQNVEHADLVSYGVFGLIDAIEKFDPQRGFKFETYAIARIKGAIVDELRSIDWVPRSVRAKARSMETAQTRLEASLHRSPSDRELAKELGLTDGQLRVNLHQMAHIGLGALDETLSAESGETLSLGDTVADPTAGPTQSESVEEMRRILVEALAGMLERELMVFTLYYYEGLTLAEIGQVLGVTESRVCQIHTKAVLRLRSGLSAAERESTAIAAR